MSGLRAHQRAVHREEDGGGFECDECGREFGYRSVRDRHVGAMHGLGAEGRKRRISDKDKAFGRLNKRSKGQKVDDIQRREESEDSSEIEQIVGEIQQSDGGELEKERGPLLVESVHGTAICVM